MLNALLVFGAVVLLFVYLLAKKYDDDAVISSSSTAALSSAGKAKDWSKRRKRKGKPAAGAGCFVSRAPPVPCKILCITQALAQGGELHW